VAEVFSDQDEGMTALDVKEGVTAGESAGEITFFRMFGLVSGTSNDRVVAFLMDRERWSHLRGRANATCAACFSRGRPMPCPSLAMSSKSGQTALRDCHDDQE
jgi:hypothetical protein